MNAIERFLENKEVFVKTAKAVSPNQFTQTIENMYDKPYLAEILLLNVRQAQMEDGNRQRAMRYPDDAFITVHPNSSKYKYEFRLTPVENFSRYYNKNGIWNMGFYGFNLYMRVGKAMQLFPKISTQSELELFIGTEEYASWRNQKRRFLHIEYEGPILHLTTTQKNN